MHSAKQTASTTYRPRNRQSNGCMQCADIWSNPHGYGQLKHATTLVVQCSRSAMSASTTPKTNETVKGHMNQNQKNVRSMKVKQVPFEIAVYPEMRGKKIQDVYISAYKVCKTTFSDQTGKFLTRSKQGIIAHAYIQEGQLDAVGCNVPRFSF